MIENNILGWLFKLPAILVLVVSFFGGIYASVKHIGGIGYGTPLVLFVILGLYLVGEYYHRRNYF